jgi:hypothetical protein
MKIFIAMMLFAIIGCSPNQSYYKYSFDETKTIRKVAIAPFDLFFPLPDQIKNSTDLFCRQIYDYVRKNGIEVVQNNVLIDSWNKERSESGGFFNQLTGEVDSSRFDLCIKRTIMKTCAIQNLDGIILPTIKIRFIKISGIYGFWDGVYRKVRLDDPTRSIEQFSYSGQVPAYSLQIIVLDNEGIKTFKSLSGVDIMHKLIFNNSHQVSEFNDHAFQNSETNLESIQIGFHPFIKFSHYPKKPQFYGNKQSTKN